MYDIFTNPKLKAIMTLYIVFMGFDLVGRTLLSTSPQEVKPAENISSTTGDESSNSNVQSTPNGDAIPVDRSAFGGSTAGGTYENKT